MMMDMAYLDIEQIRALLLDAQGRLVEPVQPLPGDRRQLGVLAAESFAPQCSANAPA